MCLRSSKSLHIWPLLGCGSLVHATFVPGRHGSARSAQFRAFEGLPIEGDWRGCQRAHPASSTGGGEGSAPISARACAPWGQWPARGRGRPRRSSRSGRGRRVGLQAGRDRGHRRDARLEVGNGPTPAAARIAAPTTAAPRRRDRDRHAQDVRLDAGPGVARRRGRRGAARGSARRPRPAARRPNASRTRRPRAPREPARPGRGQRQPDERAPCRLVEQRRPLPREVGQEHQPARAGGHAAARPTAPPPSTAPREHRSRSQSTDAPGRPSPRPRPSARAAARRDEQPGSLDRGPRRSRSRPTCRPCRPRRRARRSPAPSMHAVPSLTPATTGIPARRPSAAAAAGRSRPSGGTRTAGAPGTIDGARRRQERGRGQRRLVRLERRRRLAAQPQAERVPARAASAAGQPRRGPHGQATPSAAAARTRRPRAPVLPRDRRPNGLRRPRRRQRRPLPTPQIARTSTPRGGRRAIAPARGAKPPTSRRRILLGAAVDAESVG